MSLEYVGLKEINGPLIALDGVGNTAYEEMVDITLNDGTIIASENYFVPTEAMNGN